MHYHIKINIIKRGLNIKNDISYYALYIMKNMYIEAFQSYLSSL